MIRWLAACDFMKYSELESLGPNDDWVEQPDWFYADFVAGGRLDGCEAPTHWQPLPEPPK